MALYDDKWFLLSHVSHSFVLSDDTGNSEVVFTDAEAIVLRKKVKNQALEEGTQEFLESLSHLDDIDDVLPHSFEIRMGRHNMGYHRPRCNTEIKLDKLRRDRRNVPKIKTVVWREGENKNEPVSQQALEELFPRKDVDSIETPSEVPRSVSLLSHQLETLPPTPSNPFEVFSRFAAAAASVKEKTRKLQIYLEMAPESERDFPMVIQVVASAKIIEVIGYIAWKYTKEHRQPPLKGNLNHYDLYMAESDGTIEKEFPSLDRKEPLSKFGFNILGFVDSKKDSCELDANGQKMLSEVTVVLPDGTFSVIELETRDITLKQLMDKAFSKREKAFKLNARVQHKYNIERKDRPGECLEQESLLSGYECDAFYIVRENSRRKNENDSSLVDATDKRMKHQISLLDAPLYREYNNVVLLSKVSRVKVEVMLGISEQKLEVYPKQQVISKTMFWRRPKSPVTYNMEGVMACDIVEKKANGRWTFRIVLHTDHGYGEYDFESDEATAGEINSKVNHLLNWRPSEARDDYMAQKEKKVQRRQSLHLKQR